MKQKLREIIKEELTESGRRFKQIYANPFKRVFLQEEKGPSLLERFKAQYDLDPNPILFGITPATLLVGIATYLLLTS